MVPGGKVPSASRKAPGPGTCSPAPNPEGGKGRGRASSGATGRKEGQGRASVGDVLGVDELEGAGELGHVAGDAEGGEALLLAAHDVPVQRPPVAELHHDADVPPELEVGGPGGRAQRVGDRSVAPVDLMGSLL